MKLNRTFITIVLMHLSSFLYSQLTLTNESKDYRISKKDDCYIKTIPIKTDSIQRSYKIYIGSLKFKDSNTVFLDKRAVNTIQIYSDGTQEVFKVPDDGTTEKIDLKIDQIESIENFRPWFAAPATIGWLSLISGLVVSPLISIDYSNGEFNQTRFFKTSAVSLSIGAPCFVIAYKFGRKKIHLTTTGNKNRPLWKIKK